ncbi:Zn-ribbon domain-containing OB-fold protein [Haliea salexigens]|uniref:Zn-ribbon domain-containing OB-fold protein n=1 Tax=Haliea salexigens TaxID=287487 RepID=UPI001183B4D4|nr:OB-fold domain-containing protein [Haliea salexigens]
MTVIAQALPGDNISITMDNCTAPFWEAAREHRLEVPKCGACGTFRMPPRPYCPQCQSQEVEWTEISGKGTVYSFALCNRSPFTGEEFHYVPVVMDLDDAPGIRLVSNLVEVEPSAVSIGMRAEVAWNPIRDGWVLPIFRPTAE